ncbi:plasmid partition protein ParG [Vreelandella arcis]|uniref:ParG protein n=1 Tax=Vreelandella arcis TaxID=416873 RepID=A0A1H0JT96_9GAMM|nr:plasmid partition protein ParG [Halomonas arcis]SDO47015.1 ParG protein [Halomonas arcis]
MSNKKVSIGGKPSAKKAAEDTAMDAWVGSRKQEPPKEPMKRLTIDIPTELHAKLKADCAMRGRKMTDEIRDLLMEKYGNQ